MTTQGTEDFRRTSYDNWQATAPCWAALRERIEQPVTPVREWLLAALDPKPGQTLLELAAGAGETGFEAARMVGETGRLISTDFAPAMVEAARRRGEELGLRNVEYRVMDAERIDLENDSVDGVLCRFGYMLMADAAAALAETRRVLRPGGRAALAVWGPPERNPTFSVLGATLVRRGHLPPPEPGAPGQFSMADADRTRGLLEGAGFTDVRLDEVPVRFEYESLDEYLGLVTGASAQLAGVFAGLPGGEREEIERAVIAGFEPFRSDGGYELPGVALCAVGR